MVRDDAERIGPSDDVVRARGAGRINEAADDGPGSIQLGDGRNLMNIQESLNQRAIDFFPDPPS